MWVSVLEPRGKQAKNNVELHNEGRTPKRDHARLNTKIEA